MEAETANFGFKVEADNQQERIAALLIENSTLRADLGCWKQLYQAAKEREKGLLKALVDSKAQVAYLQKQRYGKTPPGPAKR